MPSAGLRPDSCRSAVIRRNDHKPHASVSRDADDQPHVCHELLSVPFFSHFSNVGFKR